MGDNVSQCVGENNPLIGWIQESHVISKAQYSLCVFKRGKNKHYSNSTASYLAKWIEEAVQWRHYSGSHSILYVLIYP